MKCPNCGKEIANDSKFCDYCGLKLNFASVSDISQEEISHASVGSETDNKIKITCPNCGKAIARDSKFCEYCGAEITTVPKSKGGKIGLIVALSVICIIGIALFLTTTDVLKHAEFAEEQVVVDSPEGEILIALTNRANYEMYVHPDWCSVEVRKGNLHVKYADNYAPKDRRGDIVITSKGKNSKVEIFQKANKPSLLSTSSNSLKFSHNADSKSISIKTDGAWLVSSEGLSDVKWLTAKKESDQLKVKVQENKGSDRSCSIKIRAGEKTKTVTITQDGNPTFLIQQQLQQKLDMENDEQKQQSTIEKSRSKGATYLSTVPSSVKLLSSGGDEKITVKSDGEWTISTDDSQWYSLQRSGNTITLTIQQNYSTTPRSGYFDVKAGKLYKRFKVSQGGAAKYLQITPSTYTFGCNGGEKAFKVNTDGEWRVISPLAGWGHLREDHTNNQVIVNVDNNCRGSKRDDYFVVSTGNKKEQGFIIQY